MKEIAAGKEAARLKKLEEERLERLRLWLIQRSKDEIVEYEKDGQEWKQHISGQVDFTYIDIKK